ncbi:MULTISPECIES: hypothetical protein [Xanthomonas]|nr:MULTISPECIES: hypothetical protein [Xanthomonas]APP82732.1 hypothetical protein BJD10_23975 [Xanthomonas hortorum pv. gardneri]APR13369.1 hypothetical protein BI314_24420 [Xanthomonas citri pv. citri]APR22695.1 hypothetical protein BI316_24335 [Xanthomonas citri pv. citri]AUZ53617.1 hypothetical protein CLM98_24070 [Xanthomonas citri pv. citri]KLB02945.1 hypothetical protein SM17710_01865 [Xanthomonas hortorum pv. gardneri]
MGKTPAQKKRNKYLASVRARGASGHNFWFVSPPQDTQALPLTLSSDIELGDFFYLEGSPDVAFVDYFPLWPGRAHSHPGRQHFATVTTLEEGTELDVDLALSRQGIGGRPAIDQPGGTQRSQSAYPELAGHRSHDQSGADCIPWA